MKAVQPSGEQGPKKQQEREEEHCQGLCPTPRPFCRDGPRPTGRTHVLVCRWLSSIGQSVEFRWIDGFGLAEDGGRCFGVFGSDLKSDAPKRIAHTPVKTRKMLVGDRGGDAFSLEHRLGELSRRQVGERSDRFQLRPPYMSCTAHNQQQGSAAMARLRLGSDGVPSVEH